MEKVMTPEFRLLVRACGAARCLPTYPFDMDASVQESFDGARFVDLAYRHKVSATAYAGLRHLGATILEPAHAILLKRQAARDRLMRELILEDLRSIAEAAPEFSIPLVVLKGPGSSLELYGDALVREYDDLDILVDLPDIGPVLPFMRSLGYEPRDPDDFDSPYRDVRLLQRRHHSTFLKAGRSFRVEVHDRRGWEEETLRQIEMDTLFSRAIALQAPGFEFMAPCLADQAALIVAHGTQHAWCLLHWVLDAAALLNRNDDQLHRGIAARIRALGLDPQLKLACDIVQTLYPIDLPAPIDAVTVCEPELSSSFHFAISQLRDGGGRRSSLKNLFLFDTVYFLPMLRRWRDRLTFLAKPFKIPLVDMKAFPLPRPLLFMHVLLRPAFILSRRLKHLKQKREKASVCI